MNYMHHRQISYVKCRKIRRELKKKIITFLVNFGRLPLPRSRCNDRIISRRVKTRRLQVYRLRGSLIWSREPCKHALGLKRTKRYLFFDSSRIFSTVDLRGVPDKSRNRFGRVCLQNGSRHCCVEDFSHGHFPVRFRGPLCYTISTKVLSK